MKRVLSTIVVTTGLIFAGAALTTAYAADAGMPKPDEAKGEQLYANGDMGRGVLACASCHGAAGNSTIPANPNLAALPHEYIAKQLMDFQAKGEKAAARRGAGGADTIMTSLAAQLTPEEIQNIAYYLSRQALDPEAAATATNEATMDRGQLIWRAGLTDRAVPACAACHSANGAGLPGEYPRLAGQHPEYLSEQLELFRSGDRANSEMMNDIAGRLSDKDIAAVADYAAGLR